MNGCALIPHYLHTDWIWPEGHSLLTLLQSELSGCYALSAVVGWEENCRRQGTYLPSPAPCSSPEVAKSLSGGNKPPWVAYRSQLTCSLCSPYSYWKLFRHGAPDKVMWRPREATQPGQAWRSRGPGSWCWLDSVVCFQTLLALQLGPRESGGAVATAFSA